MKSKRIVWIPVLCFLFLAAGFTVSHAAAQNQSSSNNAQAQQQSQLSDASQSGSQGGQAQQKSQEMAETEGTQLYISPSTLKSIQRSLSIKGFNVGKQDGVWGQNTAQAITQFQKSQGLEPTGNLNIETLDYLGVSQALRQGAQSGDQQQMAQAGDAGEGAPLFVSPSSVRQIQQQLSKKGIDPGPIDGIWGPNTKQAVSQYEKKQDMASTGNINIQMISSLGLDQMVAALTVDQQDQQPIVQAQQQQGEQQVRGYYGPQGEKTDPQQTWEQRSGRKGTLSVYGPEEQPYAGKGAPLFVSADLVRQIQEKLNQAGYDAGNTKGNWDSQTSQALRNYQKAKGLEPTGNLNISTVNTMFGSLSADLFKSGGGQGQQQSQ